MPRIAVIQTVDDDGWPLIDSDSHGELMLARMNIAVERVAGRTVRTWLGGSCVKRKRVFIVE